MLLLTDGCQIGSTFEECLSNRHFLLICNYTPGEFVVYQSSSGVEFRYARVVESKYKPGCDITDRYLELHTDMHNDCPVSAYASPLQVYKILDTHRWLCSGTKILTKFRYSCYSCQYSW